ncbi:3D domain-containing protein [Desulfonatronum parangueonense]
MRFLLPVLTILALGNAYHILKPVDGNGREYGHVKEYRYSMEKDLELMKARDEVQILEMILAGYRIVNNHQAELMQIREENELLRKILAGYKEANTLRLRLTAYTARKEECNEDVDNTAIMQKPTPGWTVAVSHDLRGWLGKRVYIEGFGVRLVSDLMHARHKQSIDILVPDVPMAKSIGVRKNVLVTLIEPLAADDTGLDHDLHASMESKPAVIVMEEN